MRLTANRFLLISFAGLIALGTAALLLPGSMPNRACTWDEALFTSASAVCVTGLVVVDTGKDFSLQGQLIILALIQVGGLGILTFSSWLLLSIGRRLSIRGTDTMSSAFRTTRHLGIRELITRVIVYTAVIEGIGALVLFSRFTWEMPPLRALYHAVFHSIAAFCNAGFSLNSDNLMSYRGDVVVNTVIMALIALGGLGFVVLAEFMDRWKRRKEHRARRFSLHTQMVIGVSVGLWVFGAASLFLMEWNFEFREIGLFDHVLASLFQSVTCRTAGFNTVDIGGLRASTLCVMILLMFVGASPGSTGGGVKTTTFGILLALVRSRMRGRVSVDVRGRQIPFPEVAKALSVFALGLATFVAILFGLHLTESMQFGSLWMRQHFLDYAFEVVSALGTVGLSTGVTPQLTEAGRVLIVIAMFAGRVGPLTVASSVLGERRAGNRYEYPEESVMVG